MGAPSWQMAVRAADLPMQQQQTHNSNSVILDVQHNHAAHCCQQVTRPDITLEDSSVRAHAGAGICAPHSHFHLLPHYLPPPLLVQTADVLEGVASIALKTRLKECRVVKASVSCDAWSLLSGRVNGAKIYGEGWRSPLNLTAQILEVCARGWWRGLGDTGSQACWAAL